MYLICLLYRASLKKGELENSSHFVLLLWKSYTPKNIIHVSIKLNSLWLFEYNRFPELQTMLNLLI